MLAISDTILLVGVESRLLNVLGGFSISDIPYPYLIPDMAMVIP
jgi:hypothetical protein